MSKAQIISKRATVPFKVRSGWLQQILAFSSLILMFIIFSLLSSNFFQFSNIINILLSTAVTGVLALGSTYVIISGGIDLSVGTVMSLTAVMTGTAITYWGWPTPLGLLVGLATGALCGFVSGVAVAKLKIPPFIATLAMMMIAKGLALVIAGIKPVYFPNTPHFSDISLGSGIGRWLTGEDIPNAVFVFFGAAIIAGIVLSRTIVGRYNFAIGSNEEATRLSGVNVSKWKIIIYTLTGVFTGIAGILLASRLNSAQPATGSGYELEAIAAVVIGGTSLSGGTGSITGTVIGALILSVLTNGLQILSVKSEWQTVVVGIVIFLAVCVDILRRRKA